MIGQPKPLASLSSTLLARKGQAKPAMRPQGFGGFGTFPGAQDDLGWNDMGHGEPVALAPPAYEPSTEQEELPIPPVLKQREVLAEEFAPAPVAAPVPVSAPAIEEPAPPAAVRPVSTATARRIGRETGTRQAKAAFTLRLDHDRHLRLRLASALRNRSAQQLVTEALDQFLENLPEVDALMRQVSGSEQH